MRKHLCSFLLLTLLGLWFALSGCQAESSHIDDFLSKNQPVKGIDSVSMRGDLINFTDYATNEISTSATQIASTTSNPGYRQLALAWRLRMAAAFHTIAAKQDPRQGLVLGWMLAAKQSLYFETKLNGNPSDTELAQMVETAKAVEESIARIIHRYLPPDAFAKAQQQIKTLAKEKPLGSLTGGNRFDQEDLNPAQTPDGVAQVLLLPLAPLTSMQGVTDTAAAINRLNNSVVTLGLLVDDLPLQARWQAQYMFLDVQTGDLAKSLGAMAAQVTIKAERLTALADQAGKTLEKLPEILNAQQKTLSDTLDIQRAKVFEDIKTERIAITKSIQDIVTGVQKQADTLKSDATAASQRIQAALAVERTKTLEDIDTQRQLITHDARATVDYIFYRALIFAFILFLAALVLIWYAQRKTAVSAVPPRP